VSLNFLSVKNRLPPLRARRTESCAENLILCGLSRRLPVQRGRMEIIAIHSWIPRRESHDSFRSISSLRRKNHDQLAAPRGRFVLIGGRVKGVNDRRVELLAGRRRTLALRASHFDIEHRRSDDELKVELL